MAIQKRSISIDSRLADLIDEVVAAEGSTFSAVIGDCVEQAIKFRLARLNADLLVADVGRPDDETQALLDSMFAVWDAGGLLLDGVEAPEAA